MKIKCDDGVVRRFATSKLKSENVGLIHDIESECLECGKSFGIHDTNILKKIWKKHIC